MTTEQPPLQEAFHFSVLKEHDPELYEPAQRVHGQAPE